MSPPRVVVQSRAGNLRVACNRNVTETQFRRLLCRRPQACSWSHADEGARCHDIREPPIEPAAAREGR